MQSKGNWHRRPCKTIIEANLAWAKTFRSITQNHLCRRYPPTPSYPHHTASLSHRDQKQGYFGILTQLQIWISPQPQPPSLSSPPPTSESNSEFSNTNNCLACGVSKQHRQTRNSDPNLLAQSTAASGFSFGVSLSVLGIYPLHPYLDWLPYRSLA